MEWVGSDRTDRTRRFVSQCANAHLILDLGVDWQKEHRLVCRVEGLPSNRNGEVAFQPPAWSRVQECVTFGGSPPSRVGASGSEDLNKRRVGGHGIEELRIFKRHMPIDDFELRSGCVHVQVEGIAPWRFHLIELILDSAL